MPLKLSVRKTRRLRALLAKHYRLPEPPEPKDTMLEQIIMAILWEDAPPARARLAYVNLVEEFADWNEVRVSMAREVGRVLESCGLKSEKAVCIKRILARAIEDLYCFEFERLRERSDVALRDWFMTLEGVPHHVAATVLFQVYHYPHVLVDSDILRVIQRLGLVDQEAGAAEVESALDRVVPVKEAHLVYHALHRHALDVCTKTAFDCAACPLQVECVAGKARIAEIKAAKKKPKKKPAKKRTTAKAPSKAKRSTKTARRKRGATARAKAPKG